MVDKRLMNINDLSKHLGVQVSTVYSWVSQKKIPYVKMGRLVKFDAKDIETWVDEKKVQTYK